MAFTAKDVMALREKTGAGVMDCKKALTDTDGDMEKAMDLLRERGIAKAEKKASRIAAEGIVYAYIKDKKGVLVEVNCESDFVAKNPQFTAIAEEISKVILAENSIDMIVLAGFMSILSENFTAAYPKRIVNVHPSLIPSFCGKGFYGLHVHEAALAYGVKVTGATVHYVNEIPDGGEIILQKAVEIEEGDTPEVLQRRVMEQAEWILLPKAVEMVAARLQKGQ